MTPLSTLLAELDAAHEKMTPGPWQAIEQINKQWRVDGNDDDPLARCAQGYDEQRANAQGIVALVNAYPALKEGIERLERENNRLRTLVAQQQEALDRLQALVVRNTKPTINSD